MENIFNQLGYRISECGESLDGKELKLFFINNTDGSIRWVWPSHTKQPLFLKFYAVNGLRSIFFVMAIKAIFAFRLQRFFFKKKKFRVEALEKDPINFNIQQPWALFKGTIGPNNKSVLFTQKEGVNSFIKIASTEKSEKLLEVENAVLNRLYASNMSTFIFPEVYHKTKNLLEISDISVHAERANQLSNAHINALIELNELTSLKMPLRQNENWTTLKKDVQALTIIQDSRMPKGMIRKLNKLISQVNEHEEVEVCLSHGDFTPWNMFIKEGKLHVYDWELANTLKPLGFDLFHFIIQKGVLVEHKNWVAIKRDIDECVNCQSFSQLSKFKTIDSNSYLKLYLIFNAVYYLKLYAEQKLWHTQIYWLLNVWNEGLSDFLANSTNQRELVLMDMFDFLLSKNYAAIKFKNMYPEQLSEFSDVDICAEKNANPELQTYFKNHPLVSSLQIVSKSFMCTHQLIFKNGDILSVDIIWNIKRKGLEILNAKAILNNVYINYYGVKMMDVYDNARYIGLFYTLNNTRVPKKYNYYEEILCKSNHILDKYLYTCFMDETCDKKNLVKFIKSQKANQLFKGLTNQWNYLLDCVTTVFKNSGTVITFSGVDGAGKSTVIENLKYKVEKQLRKRVVVLRHRPSMLPILSAWVKGKAKAEKEAAMNLPRLGKNGSKLSSLVRFGYYFVDYLIGQLLVHMKYVWKGYVVIYDRYYFDFINDSKRSNIVLPKFIFNAGFNLLIKPKLNFFLYADSETILARKQELDKYAIEELTASYLKQFNELNLKNSNAKYISINNIHLNETLDTLFYQITKQAAA